MEAKGPEQSGPFISPEPVMEKFVPALILAALLPLAGCATSYGYSSGAYAGYDGSFDHGYYGYGGSNSPYGGASYRPYGNGYYAGQSSDPANGGGYYGPSHGAYYDQRAGNNYYSQGGGYYGSGYTQPNRGVYYRRPYSAMPPYGAPD
jgi:hypothetical protein